MLLTRTQSRLSSGRGDLTGIGNTIPETEHSMHAEWEQAARKGDVGTLERLLVAGADINARDAHGQTALMLAARIGHQPAVTLLVERGADLNHTAKFHLSALMLAVLNNHSAIVETLVKAGADRSIRGAGAPGFDGKTAMELAQAAGWHEIVDFLRAVEQGSPEGT